MKSNSSVVSMEGYLPWSSCLLGIRYYSQGSQLNRSGPDGEMKQEVDRSTIMEGAAPHSFSATAPTKGVSGCGPLPRQTDPANL